MLVIDFHLSIFLLIYILLVCVTFIILKFKKRREHNVCSIVLMELYIMCLIKLVYMPIRIIYDREMYQQMGGDGRMNYVQLIPFQTIIDTLKSNNWIVQLGGNIVLIIPVIFFAYYIFSVKSLKKCILLGVFVTVFIEITQLIIDVITKFPNKVCDVDDIILNIIGVMVAVLVIRCLNGTNLDKKISNFLK